MPGKNSEAPNVMKPTQLPKRTGTGPLMALDDPGDLEVSIEDSPPDTARPDFEPDKFTQQVESAEQRMTAPPAATYEMLRDSCKTSIAADVMLDEDRGVRPSSAKHKVTK